MTLPRSAKHTKAYRTYLKSLQPDRCVFCHVDEESDQFIEGTTSFIVLKNTFAYSVWDSQAVVDHLIVIPRSHTDNIGGMASEQKVEYVDILEKYERAGYNIYARAPGSNAKTVVHQHTHFIKTAGPLKQFMLSIRKPLVRIVR